MNSYLISLVFFILTLTSALLPWLGYRVGRYQAIFVGLKIVLFGVLLYFLYGTRSEPLWVFVPGLLNLFILPIVIGLKSS